MEKTARTPQSYDKTFRPAVPFSWFTGLYQTLSQRISPYRTLELAFQQTAFRPLRTSAKPSVVAEVELDQRRQMELERRLREQEAAQIRQELLSGLEEIARSETDPAQRLFAEDTARGLN